MSIKTTKHLKFKVIEELHEDKKELLFKLETVFKNKLLEKEYRQFCLDILNEYRSIIEKFNKSVEANVAYIKKVYEENSLGIENEYLIDLQEHLLYEQKCENRIFEYTEEKTYKIAKTTDHLYVEMTKFELRAGLKVVY